MKHNAGNPAQREKIREILDHALREMEPFVP
jgi:hypothetical protein